MLFYQMTLEGWRSGQSQQTVNLPSLALRWFKSSSLHQIFTLLIFVNCSFTYSQDSVPFDRVRQRTDAFLEKTRISYKQNQTFKIINATANLGFSVLDNSASGMTYFMFGISLYSFTARPIYRSALMILSEENINTQLPILRMRYKRLRAIQSVSNIVSAFMLTYLLANDTFSDTAKPTMIGVVSQIYGMAISGLLFESPEEKYLDLIEKDYL